MEPNEFTEIFDFDNNLNPKKKPYTNGVIACQKVDFSTYLYDGSHGHRCGGFVA